jgi:hypothetical protein
MRTAPVNDDPPFVLAPLAPEPFLKRLRRAIRVFFWGTAA